MARGDPPLLRRRRLPLLAAAEPPAGWRKEPARGAAINGIAAAAPRQARARAVGTVNRRGRYGSPIPTCAPRRITPAARCGIGRTGRDPLGYARIPAQPAGGRLASGPDPVTLRPGPDAYRHQREARAAADSPLGAPQEPLPPAAWCGLALAMGSLARKRQRCRSIGRGVAIPFMRFLR